eukprot:s2070_g4.t1
MLVELFSSRAFLQCSYRVPDPMIETRIKHDCLLLEALQSNQAIHGRDYFEQLRQPRMNAAQYSVHEAWQPALPPPRRPAPPASHASRKRQVLESGNKATLAQNAHAPKREWWNGRSKRQSQHWRCAAAGSAFITVQARLCCLGWKQLHIAATF